MLPACELVSASPGRSKGTSQLIHNEAPLQKDSALTTYKELFTLAKLLLPGLAHP